ncbi:aminodeoxychorismate/anthranilate synthase component II, partial [bacterium]|nr:aminodeoxychorismate/anthranilate synthase component II [bacterium]
DYLRVGHAEVKTIRYDHLEVDALPIAQMSGLVISPGPGRPQDYPKHFELYRRLQGKIPILGVCLGHQSLCCYYGAKLVHAAKPMHGKVSNINCVPHAMYAQVETVTQVTRYHSLLVQELPPQLMATAYTVEGELMSFAHRELPVWGWQFHPEAVLTASGRQMIKNWLQLAHTFSSQMTVSLNLTTN